MARHSWASIAQTNQVPLHIISGAMGHDSEVTTQIYLSSIQISQIDEAKNMIINSLKSKKRSSRHRKTAAVKERQSW